ncbi:MAG: VWA domain-containing protein [Vampirovibrionales bacterium]|nr:VWA domain-containing protein [Vampirovibrionales bacterium]
MIKPPFLMGFLSLITLALLLLTGVSLAQQQSVAVDSTQPPITLIILDASYSMSEPLGGRDDESKMVVAKRTVLDVLKRLPPNARIGLRVYGHRNDPFFTSRNKVCTNSELVVPVGVGNQYLIASKLVDVQPRGATPIHYSLLQALQSDLAHLPSELQNAPKEVLLISDGMETCDADPCGVAVEAQRLGIPVKINVVGFGVNDTDAERQLNCIAKATFGEFITATTEARLADVLTRHMRAQTQVEGKILLPSRPSAKAPLPAGTVTHKTTVPPKKLPIKRVPKEQEYRL